MDKIWAKMIFCLCGREISILLDFYRHLLLIIKFSDRESVRAFHNIMFTSFTCQQVCSLRLSHTDWNLYLKYLGLKPIKIFLLAFKKSVFSKGSVGHIGTKTNQKAPQKYSGR